MRREGIAPAGIVVAVSGGPDSVALLLALIRLRIELPLIQSEPQLGPLLIAHLNHKLRGEASDADEAFVQNLVVSLSANRVPGLEFRHDSVDVACHAQKRGRNLEGVARHIRYEWLAKVAQDAGISFVATGHTADDQAETVLFRLLRGTGLKGLSGIAARRVLIPGIELVRPLLGVTRMEILQFLRNENQSYCHDVSNLDRKYTRNRIRHELIPELAREYNPRVVSALGRLAEQAAKAFRARDLLASRLLAEVERPRAGSLVILDHARLATAPRHCIREVFHCLWAREGWPMSRMGFREWDSLAGIVLGESVALDLPEGLFARRVGHVVQIGRAS
jgi:tRNA(Ile)-lysidine synthase